MKALVLSGGAVKGAWQAGALLGLVESGKITSGFDIISGTSVGAINAAFLAMYPQAEFAQGCKDLVALWASIKGTRDIWKWHFPKYVAGLWKTSFASTAPLHSFLKGALDSKRIKASAVQLRVSSVSLKTRRLHTFDHSFPDIILAVMASASFPVMFPPVEIDGELYIDGGTKDNAPVSSVMQPDVHDIVVVACENPHTLYDFNCNNLNPVSVGIKTIGILTDELMLNDLAFCKRKGKNIKLLTPSAPMETSLEFDSATIAKYIANGRLDGLAG